MMQVFLREAERQRLQTLLHQEVLRRIVTLQRRFRAVLERKHFVDMRQATCVIQVRWESGKKKGFKLRSGPFQQFHIPVPVVSFMQLKQYFTSD